MSSVRRSRSVMMISREDRPQDRSTLSLRQSMHCYYTWGTYMYTHYQLIATCTCTCRNGTSQPNSSRVSGRPLVSIWRRRDVITRFNAQPCVTERFGEVIVDGAVVSGALRRAPLDLLPRLLAQRLGEVLVHRTCQQTNTRSLPCTGKP